ncbi:flagellar export chaperone FliS [Kinneretia asaccharophila]|jgi:flagellar protein FliS|uniref:Flagellar secretion chaperone FliS n=1 Tax=Roseateles asaccharophilus TaxID=582607 RepID=A0A4R6MTD8_9BURK|nr:flagellar export chaperone FliS [Roseateles asaccharophilus]MDN3546519.1 flagellar export chaperone FliS [Roseateles asaccharophilus]TDP05559.1 flagellar protein FliS [Roseateles asaccharophilus]
MYGNASPFAARTHRGSAMYSKVGLETDVLNASPHRLVAMLFDGLNDAMSQARGAIAAGNVELKSRSLTRAVRILDEGLKAALNMESGQLSTDLRDLYAYMCLRLTHANLHGDSAAIEECQQLLAPVREAWASIGAEMDRSRHAPARAA